MNDLENAKTKDVGKEKHVPVVLTKKNKILVMVGSTPHPMTRDHYIEWIELETNLDNYRRYLSPQEPAIAEFYLETDEYAMNVYAHCNIHGLWVKELPKRVKSSCKGVVYIWE